MRWTLEYVDPATLVATTKTLGEWGIESARLTLQNMQEDVLIVAVPRGHFTATPLFAYLGAVKLFDPDGVCKFVGRRMPTDRQGSVRDSRITYQFHGPWSYLERTPFGQTWQDWTTTAAVARTTSHVLLPIVPGDPGTFEIVTNGAMIQEVIAFCVARNGAVMQAGNIVSALNLPLDEKTDLRCAQVIQLMLGLSPEARCFFDYSTAPPTLHCIERAQMTPITVTLGTDRIEGLQIRERDDLAPSCVAIFYERTNVVDGVSRTEFPQDIYPVASDPFSDGAFSKTVRLDGAQITHVFGYLETVPIPASPDAAWFIARGLPKEGQNNFQYVDSDGVLQHEIVDGFVQPWMDGLTFKDTFYCTYGYANADFSELGKNGQVPVNTTDLDATGGRTFERLSSVIYGEDPIPGLAQALYDGMSEPSIEGPLELHEPEISGTIGMGNTVNIAGGSGRYASIGALPQSISYDLFAKRTSIQLGPPAHLDLDSLIAMQRFNRSRRVWTDPSTQATGAAGNEGSDVTLAGTGPTSGFSSTPGRPEFAVFTHTTIALEVNQTPGEINCAAAYPWFIKGNDGIAQIGPKLRFSGISEIVGETNDIQVAQIYMAKPGASSQLIAGQLNLVGSGTTIVGTVAGKVAQFNRMNMCIGGVAYNAYILMTAPELGSF